MSLPDFTTTLHPSTIGWKAWRLGFAPGPYSECVYDDYDTVRAGVTEAGLLPTVPPLTYEEVRLPARVYLESPQLKTLWPPRKPLRAHGYPSPAQAGIHAQQSPHRDVFAYWAQSKTGVIGEVYLWGRVIEGSVGWVASHAYPKKLYVPTELLTVYDLSAEVSSRNEVRFEIIGRWEVWRHAHDAAEALRILYRCEVELASYMGMFLVVRTSRRYSGRLSLTHDPYYTPDFPPPISDDERERIFELQAGPPVSSYYDDYPQQYPQQRSA